MKRKVKFSISCREISGDYSCTTGYLTVLNLTQNKQDIWNYTALLFNIVAFQIPTLVPSSLPVTDARSVKFNILVPLPARHNNNSQLVIILKSPVPKVFTKPWKEVEEAGARLGD